MLGFRRSKQQNVMIETCFRGVRKADSKTRTVKSFSKRWLRSDPNGYANLDQRRYYPSDWLVIL